MSVTIRSCVIGEGRPKVIIPIVERSVDAILERAAQFSTLPADFVEWRADFWPDSVDCAALGEFLPRLRSALGEMPLLVTFRTKAEGGELPLTGEEYFAFCRTVCESGAADLLDIELVPNRSRIADLTALAKAHRLATVFSSHDFAKTPPKEELVSRLVEMQTLGADIAKLAVMPRSRGDLLALLSATAEMAELHPETPVITMSMGALGGVSRLSGEVFGSAMTFACVGKASAPGQFELEMLLPILERLRL